MSWQKSGRRAALRGVAWKPLVLALSLLLIPALSACTTAEGTNALASPSTFEHEVMDTTLQGLDIIPQDAPKPDPKPRSPLVMPKQVAQLPPPTKDDSAALPADSDNPQINTAGLSDADLQRLRNARVMDLRTLDGRPMTDAERKQLAARMQQASITQNQGGTRPLTLPPVSYFSSYKGKDYVCQAADGTLVALSDSRCPVKIRNAIHRDTGPVQSVDQAIQQDMVNAENGNTSN